MVNIRELLQNFVTGGLIVSSISYIANYLNPLLAAIWWAFPISLLPSLFFMKEQGKDSAYISKFVLSSSYSLVILFITTYFLSYFIKNTSNNDLVEPILKSSLIWFVCSLIFYYGVKYLDLEKYFM